MLLLQQPQPQLTVSQACFLLQLEVSIPTLLHQQDTSQLSPDDLTITSYDVSASKPVKGITALLTGIYFQFLQHLQDLQDRG